MGSGLDSDTYEPFVAMFYFTRYLIFPKTCIITGEKIPAFSKAYKKVFSYEINYEVVSEHMGWVSKAGYTWLQLKDEV